MNFNKKQSLATLALSLLLGQAHAEYWTPDELVTGFNGVSAQISRGELQAAEQSLAALQQRTEKNDVRIEQYQRELAGAYLKQGQQQLAAQNPDAASQSLAKAKPYMAMAPGLKGQYEQSLAASQGSTSKPAAKPAAVVPAKPVSKPQVAAAAAPSAERRTDVEQRLQQAEATLAQKEAERARQQKLAEEQAVAKREAAAAQAAKLAAAKATAAAEAAAAAVPRALLIDPTASSSSVPMPMLDANDRDSLRTLLDAVAADVVAFDCAVRLQVREAKDYPFVAALLSARIKKLEPGFNPQFSPVLKPDQEPRLVLSPQSSS